MPGAGRVGDNSRRKGERGHDLSAPMSPTKGLFDLSTYGAEGTFNVGATEGTNAPYTPVADRNYKSSVLGRHKERRDQTAEDTALATYQSRAAGRAMASNYIFKMPKTKSARPSGIGMRNNAATLG